MTVETTKVETWGGSATPASRRAVVFGAGKMACGLLGGLLARAGFRTTFVARRGEVVDAINRQRGYTLVIAGAAPRRVAVRGCSALELRDEAAVVEAVAKADVVFTAVGIGNLTAIAPLIAAGLWRRGELGRGSLNVVASENLPGAGAYLRHQVVGAAHPAWAILVDHAGGFSAATTRRIMTGGAVVEGELTVTVDGDGGLVVDERGLKVPFPAIDGISLTAEFAAAVLRKLYTLNCAHAIAAYLGYREGCRYVHEAISHPRVGPVVRAALEEARAALRAEFPSQVAAIDQDVADALAQIANPALADPIRRVARDPARKLSPRERLLGPARLARQHGLPYESLALGIAAALTYDEPTDAQAVAMQRSIRAESLEKVLTEDCGLLPAEDLARAVKRQWLSLVAAPQPEPAGATAWAAGALEERLRSLATALGQLYEPALVRDVVARVAEEFRDARPWAAAPASRREALPAAA